jgi:hypothetical protein
MTKHPNEWGIYTHPNIIVCLMIIHLFITFYLIEIKPKKSIEINKSYLYSYGFESKNPFYKFNMDTVKVLDIKNDYVLYMNDGKERSEYILNFIDNTRPLNKK